MAVSLLKAAVIVINFIAFVAKIIFNKEANKISRVFPRKTGEVSEKVPTDVTPASVTFPVIWGTIYLLQGSWITYSLSLIFRPNAPDVLPTEFFLVYILACFFNVAWLMLWARRKFALSLAVLVLITSSLGTCLFYAYSSLDSYIDQLPPTKQISNVDLWCLRALVQNGIMMYTAWVSIASCINFAIFLQMERNVTRLRAGTISLSILLSLEICWFLLENFLFRKYTKYTFVEYVVLIIGAAGVLKKQWTDGHGNQAFALVILVVAGLMLGARIIIMIMET